MTTSPDQQTVTRCTTDHLAPGLAQIQRMIGRGAHEAEALGARVRLSDGRTMIDFGSYAVMLFGHRPPSVVRAVHEALDRMPASTRMLANPYSALLARRLVHMLAPERLSRVVFGLNGADAVEAALKLAMAETGRARILAVEGAFHGKSIGALAATADRERREPVRGFLGSVRHLPLRADAVAAAMREAPAAAFIFEPVQGEGGGRELPARLLRRWCSDAHAAGAFVIADEIQVGLRRCGPISLSLAQGLEPDAVLFGKALGGGVLPLSAVICTEQLFTPLVRDPFFHTATFAGHPLSCAAGLAALELLDEIADQAGQTGRLLADGITSVAANRAGVVREGRTMGLFGVLEFASPVLANLTLLDCGRRGLLVARCLSVPNVLRVLPPVDTPPAVMAQAMEILDAACASAARRADGFAAAAPHRAHG
jgi:putrescine aminotransferase